MKIFSQYKGMGRENFILFFGKIVTNLGAMIWSMMTLILNRKLGLDATQTALFFMHLKITDVLQFLLRMSPAHTTSAVTGGERLGLFRSRE